MALARFAFLRATKTACLDLASSESPVVTDSREQAMTANKTIGFEGVHGFLSNLFDRDLHAKRVLSLANATLGGARLISALGYEPSPKITFQKDDYDVFGRG